MKCPHCGKEIETQQKRAAASRWEGMTPEQRSREMKRVRKKGMVRRWDNAPGEVKTQSLNEKLTDSRRE
jgi:hypothetical protein